MTLEERIKDNLAWELKAGRIFTGTDEDIDRITSLICAIVKDRLNLVMVGR